MHRPGLWRLEPAVVMKPWGLVHGEAMGITGIPVGLGEMWIASAQTGPGNYSNSVVEPVLRKTLAELLYEADDTQRRDLLGQPALEHLRETPHRGKTEAWHVRVAQGRTGVAAGPRSREDAEDLQRIIQEDGLSPEIELWDDEVRDLFGLIEPLQGGEVFVARAGVLHTMFAIGPESRLVIDEIQQGYGKALLPTLSKILLVQDDLLSVQVHPNDETVEAAATGKLRIDQDLQANPTVRVYDFGRRPGVYPELGFQLADPDVGLRRTAPVAVRAADGHVLEVLVADTRFVKSRVSLSAGTAGSIVPRYGSYHVLHCLSGRATLCAGRRSMAVKHGDTVFVPASMETELRIEAGEDCAFFDDSFPVLPALTGYLGSHGAGADAIESLLSPPRALPTGE